MKLIQEKLTIVLAGAFNPAILTPQWIAKNALGYADDQAFQVELLTPVAGIATPRFSFENISYAAGYKNASFFLAGLTDPLRERVCQVIGALLLKLPHTPINGIGFNFGFKVENPSQDLLNLLQVHDGMTVAFGDTASVVSRVWGSTISLNDSLIAVQCQLDGADVAIEVNFHHNVGTATDSAAIMTRPGVFAEHMNIVLAAITALTSQQLEE